MLFLYLARSLVQSKPVTVLITLPPHLSQASPTFDVGPPADHWIQKIGFLCDGCISLSSFGGEGTPSISQTSDITYPEFQPIKLLQAPFRRITALFMSIGRHRFSRSCRRPTSSRFCGDCHRHLAIPGAEERIT